jgi:hypothetical protein
LIFDCGGLFCTDCRPNPIQGAGGPDISQAGSNAMQIIRECRLRAAILTELAKESPELESQLLYVARKWLALASIREQYATDQAAHKLPALH